MNEWLILLQNLVEWLFPLDTVINNPNQIIFIISICMIIGFLMINYKYLISEYSKVYENLSYLSKASLAMFLGFIITFTGTIILFICNTVSIVLFERNVINNYAGLIVLFLSLFVGFVFFSSMNPNKKNPFSIIKKLYLTLFQFILQLFLLLGLIIFIKAVFVWFPTLIYLKILKIIAISFLFYKLLVVILLILDDFNSKVRTAFFYKQIKFFVGIIEKTYSRCERVFFFWIKRIWGFVYVRTAK